MQMSVRMYVKSSNESPWQRTYTENKVIDANQLRGSVSERTLERIGARHGLVMISFELSNIMVMVPDGQATPVYIEGKLLNGTSSRLFAGENLIEIGHGNVRLILIGCCAI